MKLIKKSSRILREAGRARVAATILFIVLAILVARWSWNLPLMSSGERALYDLRVTAFAARSAQDDRIALVVYDDQTLIKTRKRSPLDRAILARALAAIDRMGAKSIGIDILVDQPQDEDEELLRALRDMRTPTWLAYATLATSPGDMKYDQQRFLDSFIARLGTSRVRPASVEFLVDQDGTVRSWPRQPSLTQPLLAIAVAGNRIGHYGGSIRYTQREAKDRPIFSAFPIDLFAEPAIVPTLSNQIRGRHVLIGGDLVDADRFQTPITAQSSTTSTGLELHATMLAQLLDGAVPRPLPAWILWAFALLVVAGGVATALVELRWWWATLILVVQVAVIGGLPFLLQENGFDTQFLPAAGWMFAWSLAFAAVTAAARALGSVQRRFARSALGKYLPRAVAEQILREPETLVLHGEKRQLFVVFSDLEGFTELSHGMAPEMVATLLNRYLDTLSAVVLAHGGTIDKFVGDAVVAFWGAPIARADDGRNAAAASYAMWQAGEAFRLDMPSGLPPVGRTRVGLHFGEAIVGNFGGDGRFQYTALGDTMNTASRLEAANKFLGTNVIASREAVERSELDWWRPMGQVSLRGRSTPVDVFELAPDIPAQDRRAVADLVAMMKRDLPSALEGLGLLAAHDPADNALRCLLLRHDQAPDAK